MSGICRSRMGVRAISIVRPEIIVLLCHGPATALSRASRAMATIDRAV